MIKFDAWWFPDGETNLPEAMLKVHHLEHDYTGVARLTYQYQKYEICRNALPHDRRRVVLDIGAHVGLWSYWMQRDFDKVIAFEPSDSHRECFTRNVMDAPGYRQNVYLCPVALHAREGVGLLLSPPGASGGSHLAMADLEQAGCVAADVIELHTLDSYKIEACDFVKIDVEGTEYEVIEGGREFFARTHPLIILETIPANSNRYGRDPFDAVHLLESLGAHVVVRLGFHDLIMDWPADQKL